jgi:hypothetical protein
MAINVNTVYKTVLLILNKEERGYVTPDEFNKIAAQVQLETFEQYGEDLNQQLRIPQTDTDYADRIAAIDEHLSIFKTSGPASFVAGNKVYSFNITNGGTGYTAGILTTTSTSGVGLTINATVDTFTVITSATINNPGSNYSTGDIIKVTGGTGAELTITAVTSSQHFTLPTTDVFNNTVELYRLGVVNYKEEVELQRLQRMDFYNIQKSPLTKSTLSFPTYLLENERLFVKPDTIISNINCDFLRKPLDPRWGYSIGTVGQYVYDSTVYGPLLLNTGTGTLTSSITTPLSGGGNGTYAPTFTGGSGTGLVLTATVNSPITVSVGVTTAGTGYVVGDVITVTPAELGSGSSGPVITLTEANLNANSTYGSTQIELDVSEQTSFILKTLFYFGVVVKDPQIIQVAASKVQQEENNSKR